MEFSKQKKKPKANHSFFFSLPNEIMLQILQRLDFRSLFISKCVSKEWKSIISDPKFGHSYMQRANSPPKSSPSWHPWGIMPCTNKYNYYHRRDLDEYLSNIVSSVSKIDHAPTSLCISTFEDNKNKAYNLASSNGLILCVYNPTVQPYKSKWIWKLYVSNPLTKECVELPCRSVITFCSVFCFATRACQLGGENPAYVSYKVVYIRRYTDHDGEIDKITIFSSDTGRWAYVKNVKSCPQVVFGSKPFSCKGILHWFDWRTRSVLTYDPYDSPDRFGLIQLPNNSIGSDCLNVVQLGNEDVLKFGEIEDCGDHGRKLRVWRLVDYSKGEWCLEQRCLISPLWNGRMLSKLVAPVPGNGQLLCCLSVVGNKFKFKDLGSAQDVFVDHSEAMEEVVEPFYPTASYIPIGLCPWSSPFYGQARRRRNSSASSVVELRKISPVWFPSFSKY